MNKKTLGLVIVLIALATGILWYIYPKTFIDVNYNDVLKIDVMDGNTGVNFTITKQGDIKHIVENIKAIPMKKEGLSIFNMGYGLELRFFGVDENELDSFIINSNDVIRKDPFFYSGNKELCFYYIKSLERK